MSATVCLALLVMAGSSAFAQSTTHKRQPAQQASALQTGQAAAARSATASATRTRPATSPALDLHELQLARLPLADAEQQLAAADVFYGDYACDGHRNLRVTESVRNPGYVDVSTDQQRWTMKPVQSASGALRLEDVRQVTLLVQISTKSMLLDTDTGRRLMDNCVSGPQRLSRQLDGQTTLGLVR